MSEEEQIAPAGLGRYARASARCWWQMISSCPASSPLSGKKLFCDL